MMSLLCTAKIKRAVLLNSITVITLSVFIGNFAQAERSQTPSITIKNNFNFKVDQTIRVVPDKKWIDLLFHKQTTHTMFKNAQTGDSENVQVDRNGCWIRVNLGPGQAATLLYEDNLSPQRHTEEDIVNPAVTQTFLSGLPKSIQIADNVTVRLFDLLLVEVTQDFKKFQDDPDFKRTVLLENLLANGPNPIKFDLQETQKGSLATKMVYSATITRENTYRVNVAYRVTAPADVEVDVDLTTLDLKKSDGYLALAKFMPAVEGEKAYIRWKGDIQDISWKGQSPNRQARTHHWSRDINWLGLDHKGEMSVLLADFTPGMTRLIKEAYSPVNDFVVNELVLGTGDGWYMFSEFSTSNFLKAYVKKNYVIPQKEELQKTRFLCKTLKGSTDEVNREFIAWAGYKKTDTTQNNVRVEMGVPYVEFGTSYFPHSTLGENFQFWKTDGLKGERWWPYHETAWETAKSDIRRDMMIASALGLKWIRIHHLDSTEDFAAETVMKKNEQWLMDYLDFMVETARETGLYLYLDLAVSPEFAGEIAKKHGDIAPYYEIQNEILLKGIPTDLIPYWNSVYQHIKQQRPDTKVVLTGGPLFLGLYPKLENLSIDIDAVGHHCYIDGRDAPKSFADYALAVGGYASRRNKIPLNSELNWRMITRETLDQQAEHFSEIFNAFLTQQAVPIVMQFQFQETFCVPPVARGALRHYEILRFDRTLKPQGGVYRDMIRQYGDPQAPVNNLQITLDSKDVVPGQALTAPFVFKNIGSQTLNVKTECILPEGLRLADSKQAVFSFSLQPQETRVLDRRIIADKDIHPGRYHLFEKVVLPNGLFFGWGTLSFTHQPQLAMDRPIPEGVIYEHGLESLQSFDLSSVKAVIFGKEAPALEVDWALYVYESLRSATGADIQRYNDSNPEAMDFLKKGNLILVGNSKSNQLVSKIEQSLGINLSSRKEDCGLIRVIENPYCKNSQILLITGANHEMIQNAASDFLFRYWRHAKDAITFRVGMQSKQYQTQIAVQDKSEKEGFFEIIIPEKVQVGQEIRILVYRSSEPPAPAPGKKVWVISDSGKSFIGETNTTGELFHSFEKSGNYQIQLDKSGQSPRNIIVVDEITR